MFGSYSSSTQTVLSSLAPLSLENSQVSILTVALFDSHNLEIGSGFNPSEQTTSIKYSLVSLSCSL